ncbi:MAG: HAD family hydrolase [Muribaculaceae bacterium]|nr:HAD family hydrolase [Muribaculaceae bacterium]
MENSIKGIIFDYGGTIDCRGDHWACVIRDAYEAAGLHIGLDDFCDAYVHAERELARTPHIHPDDDFLAMMRIKVRIELQYLADHGITALSDIDRYTGPIAEFCDSHARSSIDSVRPTLDYLRSRYPMVLVSNFYGNVSSVLASYGLSAYFDDIIESAVVGVRKPDPAIFGLGVRALGLNPDEVLVVGDSLSKDIIPAESLRCRTAWIAGRQWFREKPLPERPDRIEKLADLEVLY